MQRAILFPFKYCLKIWAVVKQALKREKFFLALNDRFKEGEKIGGKCSIKYTIIISIHVMIKVLINFLNKIEVRFS